MPPSINSLPASHFKHKHRVFKHLFTLLLLTLISNTPSFAQAPLRVILIRHAEKPVSGDNLSCKGLNRSLALSAVLKHKFGLPNEIFVPAPTTGKSTKSCRMMQTIQPFATKYNLSINTSYAVTESDKLSKKILKREGTILVVWEHNELAEIAQELGVKGNPDWPDSDFDSIWIISYKNGKAILSKDTEAIKPSEECPF